uniref:Serum resistance-associated protein n=2 Tax=Trypanosoma brucei rhodesiense TaxID=31286 RepID=SRA_TRYBR|nr:lytic factor resistance gene protein [Trypanosoma brucei rhodesiense]
MPRNSGRTTSTLALALALKLLAVPVSPSGTAFDEEPVKKVCKVEKNLADVAGIALAKINNLIKQVSAATEAEARMTLAAASTDHSNISALYAAASNIVTRCVLNAVHALTSLAPIALTAATNGAKTSGHISEVIDILQQASQGKTEGKCIVKSGGGTTTVAIRQLYNKIGDLEKQTTNNCGTSVTEVLEHILKQEALKEALLSIVKKPKGAPDKTAADELVTVLINGVVPNSTAQTQKLKEKILNTLVPKLVEGSKSQVKLRILKYPGKIQKSKLVSIQELKTRVEPESSTESCKQQVATNQAQEAFCNAIGDDKDKGNNETRCSYDDSKGSDKKCTYNAEKAEANGAPATQPQGGVNEATTGNCKGKLEPGCTKAQEYEWEGKESKDSSFLVDMKLALNMVAAFVAFLF